MTDLTSLSERLTDEEWLSELDGIGRERGYSETLGERHSAVFIDESPDTLIVSFDSVATARAGSASGIPHAMLQAEIQGWSHLSLISQGDTWFRDPALYAFFDRLTDDGFFEGFERVIFYGAGAGGYAAAAYSVAAPGATVILVCPQATLDPAVAPWDDRWVAARRLDFRSRYGYAPDMTEAAREVFVIYDPLHDLDAMHAALFRGTHVRHVRFRHGGTALGPAMQDLNILGPAFELAARGRLSERRFHRGLRARRDYLPYLRNLLNRVHIEERHYLVALLCRAVLARKSSAPRFQHHLDAALRHLALAGRVLPEPREAASVVRHLPEIG